MNPIPGSDPILDCAAAAAFEQERFGGDETKEWPAMCVAGEALATAILADLRVAGVNPTQLGRVLVLVGKGHNGGDAMLAAVRFLAETNWSIEVGFVYGQNRLRLLTETAWRELQPVRGSRGERVRAVRLDAVTGSYLAVVDGVFGFQYRPPLTGPALAWLAAANRVEAELKCAVDLASGLNEPGAFQADAIYATGIFKGPLIERAGVSRLRYLDLGFFPEQTEGDVRVLTPRVLDPLRKLRAVDPDKRSYGQLAVIGGSRSFPGAVAMAVAAALQSGVGNVSAFVPESLAPAFAARWPEAMWMGCPETEDGGIAMEAGLMIRRRLSRATALLIGPGLGREPETLALVADLIRESSIPLVLDADALQAELVELGEAPRIVTPHQGEFERISSRLPTDDQSTVTVLKGPVTKISTAGPTYYGIHGGPVLARGGSGDMLAGLIGGRLAVDSSDLVTAAAQGVVWHGMAAQRVAQNRGETTVRTTAVLEELNPVIRA
ncbi:NAD(P)H-hydrate dehydratase [Opitutaceae bacterium]|nr:NAD(P)H-hydrate dehydratase [Opitutaceae bacterium]